MLIADRGEGLLTQLYSLLDRIMPTTHYVSQALLHLQAKGLFPELSRHHCHCWHQDGKEGKEGAARKSHTQCSSINVT
jgi:hypothetical protein